MVPLHFNSLDGGPVNSRVTEFVVTSNFVGTDADLLLASKEEVNSLSQALHG